MRKKVLKSKGISLCLLYTVNLHGACVCVCVLPVLQKNIYFCQQRNIYVSHSAWHFWNLPALYYLACAFSKIAMAAHHYPLSAALAFHQLLANLEHSQFTVGW